MFSKFTELFGKDFIIGYFSPAMVFGIISVILLRRMGLISNEVMNNAGQIDMLAGTTLIALI